MGDSVKVNLLSIERTNDSPKVTCDPNGLIEIEGQITNVNPSSFFIQLNDWIERYTSNLATLTRLNIKLCYISGDSIKYLTGFIQKIVFLIPANQLLINWFYEPDDKDQLQTAQILSSIVDHPFNFLEIEANNEMERKIDKPRKPMLGEFNLNEEKLNALNNFRIVCDKRSNQYILITFIILNIIGFIIILLSSINNLFLIGLFIFSAIISWGLIPLFFRLISNQDLNDYVFNRFISTEMASINLTSEMYNAAMTKYKEKRNLFERGLSRTIREYWLALSPNDFEEGVGDLFLDKGYDVWTTPATNDHGIDLYMEKDDKKYIVQCKTYKRTLGPNAAREIYGTLIDQEVDEAFLVAPMGFSTATKEFCIGKPINLLDIDDLTQMSYSFEHYIPSWIDNAKSIDDIVKYVNKNVLGKRYRGRY